MFTAFWATRRRRPVISLSILSLSESGWRRRRGAGLGRRRRGVAVYSGDPPPPPPPAALCSEQEPPPSAALRAGWLFEDGLGRNRWTVPGTTAPPVGQWPFIISFEEGKTAGGVTDPAP